MDTLPPLKAAKLAAEVYLVQSERTSENFFKDTVFSADSRKTLQATVGTRLINTKDGFGACAAGAGDYENDVFLVFRGSTFANYAADWISNARIGLEIGVSGKPVHIGFNHIFKSMIPQLETFFNSLSGQNQELSTVLVTA